MKSIMIVEGDESVRMMLVGVAKMMGFNRIIASPNTINALKLWDKSPNFEIVITDLSLSGISGIQFANIIKNNVSQKGNEKPKIILLTSHVNIDLAAAAKDIDLVLYKPIHILELQTAIEKLLA